MKVDSPTVPLCIVSPCRNEVEFAATTIRSMLAQTVRPKRWIIVDDGSSDGTPELLAEFARAHPWIQVVRRPDRGSRRVGPGVIEAFYAGWETVRSEDFEFVCKLDLDLDLPPRYFEVLLERMAESPRLGTCSGRPYFMSAGKRVSEKCGPENSVGMTKLYRVECFQDIGGFVREVMWDGIDGHMCRLKGWMARSFDDEVLAFEHLRPMGSSQVGIWTGRKRHGFGQWFMGTSLAYMSVSAVYRMTRPPYVVGGLAMWWGYVEAMMKRAKRFESDEFRPFLRRFQRCSLLHGKARALSEFDSAQRAVWEHRTSGSPGAPRIG